MALSLLSLQPKKRTKIIAVDLGSHTTKAVLIQSKGSAFELLQYAVQSAPASDKSPAILSDHLKSVTQTLGMKTKNTALMLGVNDSLLRQAEVPMAPVSDLRQILKFGSKNYLQQDLPDYVFDCFILPARNNSGATEPTKNPRCRVLVGGAKKQLLDELQQAAKEAGLVVDQISPSQIGTANAFELAEPEIFAKEVVALVDLGFKNSTITILMNGTLSLSRVVGIGGDKLTSSLAEAMGTSYAEAERIKLEMPEDAQSYMMALLGPLGRELRASIDFFEKQEDKSVAHVFFSGAAARSRFFVDTLQSELMIPSKTWNPVGFLQMALPPDRLGGIEEVAPMLAIAAGGAIAAF